MFFKDCFWIIPFLLNIASLQTIDKYTDENRPYKFGFSIQGYQHRQEEKDTRGLIKGEYGFITADGYYRVTVYATDENGDFRILSMKSYYVGFPPEDPTTTPASNLQQKNSSGARTLNFSVENINNNLSRTTAQPQNTNKLKNNEGLPACSDCSIPVTEAKQKVTFEGVNNTRNPKKESSVFSNTENGFRGKSRADGALAEPKPKSEFGSRLGQLGRQGLQNAKSGTLPPQGAPSPNAKDNKDSPLLTSSSPSNNRNPNGNFKSGLIPGYNKSNGNLRKGINSENYRLPATKETRPKLGEVRNGLPPGLTEGDIKSLLYRFNYTVGFHGHQENGYRNGDKEGIYFIYGRDGVERKSEYIANEFGYQPNITFVDLPANDLRIPDEKTEKEFGLKGYEFKWFYRK